ncbi:MAG: flagellar hook-basal body complex protein FliE [Deltaproteobacteria bacterium HGW-Deltaproteobacteria-10]|nr:MAG: flagellar hook-basal body complex protein FliE [Deltaproteobacteria bacterium HGW-Deltaproteobacteria-10]
MTDIVNISGGINPLGTTPEKPDSGKQAQGSSFGNVLKDAISDISKLQNDADKTIAKVQLEDAGSIHEAMIALEKAGISFQVMMQVRNKILDAYQEVMRMQV